MLGKIKIIILVISILFFVGCQEKTEGFTFEDCQKMGKKHVIKKNFNVFKNKTTLQGICI